MPESRCCCIFLLVLGGLYLVTGYVSISGCSGDSIVLYPNISFDSDNIVVYLHKNGENNTLLAMWSKQNSDPIKETIENGYGKKVSLHNGNIYIHNLSKYDEGKYVIQPAIRSWKIILELHLVVLLAPLKLCIPNITRVKDDLVASLDIEDCGNPAAHVSWYKLWASDRNLPVSEFNNTWEQKGKTISKIVVEKEAHGYCACAENSAMHCDRAHGRFDHCTCIATEKDNILTTLPRRPETTTWSKLSDSTKRTTDIHAERLELPEWIKGIIAALSIVSVLAIVAVIVTSILLYRRCKVSSPARNQDVSVEMEPFITTTNSSEVPSPPRNQDVSVGTEPLITTTNSSEVSSLARNQDVSVGTEPLITTTNSSEVSSPPRNQDVSVETEPLITSTNSSEVSSPPRNQDVSVETEPLITTTNSSEAPSTSRNQESSEGKEISSEWDSMLNTEIKEPVAKDYVIPDM